MIPREVVMTVAGAIPLDPEFRKSTSIGAPEGEKNRNLPRM